jgi:hypothetical protein
MTRVRSLSPARLALLERRLAARQSIDAGSAPSAPPSTMTADEAALMLGRLDELSDSEVDGLLERIEFPSAIVSTTRAQSGDGPSDSGKLTGDATEFLSRLDDLTEGEVNHLLEQLMGNDD